MKSSILTHKEVSDKRFNRSETGGYNTVEVDTYLDDVSRQLKYYENLYQKYTLLVSNFDVVKQKALEYEGVINQLRTELDELYSNGYSNKVLMQRLNKVESQQTLNFELHKAVVEINHKLDGTIGIVRSIAELLSQLVQQR